MMGVEEQRVRLLNGGQTRGGDYILYWMQSSQRVEYNHALAYAAEEANKRNKPLLVAFGLTEYPEACLRHYAFMLEGLREVRSQLEALGAQLVVRHVPPSELVIELSREACLAVVDRGYTREPRKWYSLAADGVKCPLVQVESNVVVPVEEASPKEEYSAATLRRKIKDRLQCYLKPLDEFPSIRRGSIDVESMDLDDPKLLDGLSIDDGVTDSPFRGGRIEAERLLNSFLDDKLDDYGEKRNDPTLDMVSHMSPYLHFGQVSPVEIALRVMETGSRGSEAYLEELIVRRELAINFVHYNQYHDSLECLPEWCRKTLREHAGDPRKYVYTLEEFEDARTHDSYWNAAQREMVETGMMHGYMRMYWGKKIIEWTETPGEAYRIALYLNNKYELDGRDPNGYAGVAWCFGKHDRPWKERPIFGKIRYMNDRGLERKFDMKLYLEQRRRP
jgi:deoxyribodipyrimidine photo-lyase